MLFVPFNKGSRLHLLPVEDPLMISHCLKVRFPDRAIFMLGVSWNYLFKVKSYASERSDFLHVGWTLQTSKMNNKLDMYPLYGDFEWDSGSNSTLPKYPQTSCMLVVLLEPVICKTEAMFMMGYHVMSLTKSPKVKYTIGWLSIITINKHSLCKNTQITYPNTNEDMLQIWQMYPKRFAKEGRE